VRRAVESAVKADVRAAADITLLLPNGYGRAPPQAAAIRAMLVPSGMALAPMPPIPPPRIDVLTTELSDVGQGIMARLKRETAQLHALLDGMVEPMLADVARYRRLLAGLRDAYRPIEGELTRHAPSLARSGYDLVERSKLGWLDRDLTALGSLRPGAIQIGYSLPDSTAAFGAIYVIEGATLGGQVISRQVIPALALSREGGCRFFSGYGVDTGERWRETRASIAAHLATVDAPEAANAMIAAAKDTFSLIDAALRARMCS
jgi:heme oxygenase